MKTFVFLFLSVLNLSILFSQSSPELTPQPTPPSGGSNSVAYSKSTNSYLFSYSGPDGSVTYTYDLDEGGSLHGLTATLNSSFTYWPSFFGGVFLNVADSVYYPYNHEYTLINTQLINNKLYVEWKAIPPSPLIIVEYYYRYIISIEGRTLIIKAEETFSENHCLANFNLDRSYSDQNLYSSMNHYIIGVPYLNLFNVLYTGSSNMSDQNNAFTSFFFDWDSTNASELNPISSVLWNTSVYYAQDAVYKEKTDHTRNPLNEIMYLTVSPKLEDVFPNIPNPVSKHREQSKNRVVYEYTQAFENIWDTYTWELQQLSAFVVNHGWMIIHRWQKQGYDCGYPTDVMPANEFFGGQDALINFRNIAVNDLGYLFSLHEDYWFIQVGVPGYSSSVLAQPITSLPYCGNGIKQHPLKNTKYSEFYNIIARVIHDVFETNSTYADAFTNAPPGYYVDYDPDVQGSGKFSFALQQLRQAGIDLQNIHEGPVSAEGGTHFLYLGYYDDFEAEIYTGKQGSTGYIFGGYYRPLLVNFDLLKMRDKSFVHGVGLYDRFFCTGNNLNDCWTSGVQGMGTDSVLIYTATELAYAHGGFFAAKLNNGDLLYQSGVQYNHVYPMQSLYADAEIVSILYNDNGTFLTVSDYIKKYPDTYDCFLYTENCYNDNFMGQVKITYNNGVVVYVNRHPTKPWENISSTGNWYNCHAYINGSDDITLATGILMSPYSFSLPPENGWVCFSPIIPQTSSSPDRKTDLISPYKFNLSQNYPNPFNPSTEIGFEIAKEVSVSIKVFNILGQLVTTLVNNEVKKPGIYKTAFDGRNFASGVYFYKIEAGDFIDKKKMVLIK